MKTRSEVTPDKLRGGFYTPSTLVDLALRRVEALSSTLPGELRILEPSAGDGAFLRGIAANSIAQRASHVTAVEVVEAEASKCRGSAAAIGFEVEVINDDFLGWQSYNRVSFDIAVGNPPFVRFQFVDDESKLQAQRICSELGLPDKRVANLWISVLLGALSSLRMGGVFAFVIPSECFTGTSANSVRNWLIQNCDELTFDLFPPDSFPEVLQEVVVLSGRRCIPGCGSPTVNICDHGRASSQWSHTINPKARTWTGYLLSPAELEALAEAQALPQMCPLGTIAKFDVSAVTGANAFFSVNAERIQTFGLEAWTTPLLPRIRHAKGLVYSAAEQDDLTETGAVCALLDFSVHRPDPLHHMGARTYLRSGQLAGLHRRYKTRIREPWFRVPHIRPGQLMLSKRSHWYPRAIVNAAGVVTTDTIYRGRILENMFSPGDFVAAFHNSLTLLTAEIEGRSFGGGVLELVPSEVSRLTMPRLPGFGVELDRLDQISRSDHANETGSLIAETNAFLAKADIGLSLGLLDRLERARVRLQDRRLDRNSNSPQRSG